MSQKFASYDAVSGAILGFYDEVDSPVPPSVTSVVPITDAQWQTCLATAWYTVANGVLIAPTLQVSLRGVKTAQRSLLSTACHDEIVNGFPSSALGAPHLYGGSSSDQQNLADAMNASLVPGLLNTWTTLLWCSLAGAWSLTAHTAPQVQQVHTDWIAFRLLRQQKLIGLAGQVTAATTAAAVIALTWN
jgi:hypothetical protein